MKIGCISLGFEPEQAALNARLVAENEKVISRIFTEPTEFVHVAASDAEHLREALVRLCDDEKCPLVLTLGGTAAAKNDIAPDVTRRVVDKELPGFGEIMRAYSYDRVKVAALSRATAGVRCETLIINYPARPKAILFCMRLLQEAIAEGMEQISGKRPLLRGDEIVVPLEKYLPFLKFMRVKPDPRQAHHPNV